jgi:hypothetical protein
MIKIIEIENIIMELTLQSLESKTKCKFCNKIYANKNNTERHILNSCDSKKELVYEINKLKKEITKIETTEKNNYLKNKIKILEDAVKKLVNKK